MREFESVSGPGPDVIEYRGNPVREPKKAHETDAGFDLFADVSMAGVVLRPGQREFVKCGISAAIPEGMVGLVCPRSGLAAEYGVTVLNSPGVIDAGYRGEWSVVLVHHGREPIHIRPGMRIAQVVVLKLADVVFGHVYELGSADRGDNGFGSTGA